MKPLIIIGMHRSGTTLLAELFTSLGYNLGAFVDQHNESFFFYGVNRWILRELSLSWDNPSDYNHILRYAIEHTDIESQVLSLVKSPRFPLLHFGIPSLFSKKSRLFSCPWGFKDPVSTITLPIWKSIFPSASLLLVERNGLSVAKSLSVRYRADFPRRFSWIESLIPRLPSKYNTIRTSSPDYNVNLWSTYLHAGRKAFEAFDGPKAVINYDELLINPSLVLQSALSALSVPICTTKLASFIPTIRTASSNPSVPDKYFSCLSKSSVELLLQF